MEKMELRLLTTVSERKAFEEGLTQARALKGHGFREKSSSRLGRVHLAFSDLYGVYDESGLEPERMLGGFAMHNLAQFGPSCMRPDLSHLPAETVYEIGELWSVVKGNGLSLRSARALLTARVGCVLIPGFKGARAIFIYAITRRWDMTSLYPEFEALGPPILAPYMETLDGGEVYVQPLVLQGRALLEVLSQRWAWRFEANEDCSWARVENPFAVVHVEMRPSTGYSDVRPSVRGLELNHLERPLARSLDRAGLANSHGEAFRPARLVHEDEAIKELSMAG
jgi:hypothetical protein